MSYNTFLIKFNKYVESKSPSTIYFAKFIGTESSLMIKFFHLYPSTERQLLGYPHRLNVLYTEN